MFNLFTLFGQISKCVVDISISHVVYLLVSLLSLCSDLENLRMNSFKGVQCDNPKYVLCVMNCYESDGK